MTSRLKVFGPFSMMKVGTPLKAWCISKGWVMYHAGPKAGVKLNKLSAIVFGYLFSFTYRA